MNRELCETTTCRYFITRDAASSQIVGVPKDRTSRAPVFNGGASDSDLSLAVGLGNMLAKHGMEHEMHQLISKVCARPTDLQPSNVAQEAGDAHV
jgi:hypothetical protein